MKNINSKIQDIQQTKLQTQEVWKNYTKEYQIKLLKTHDK